MATQEIGIPIEFEKGTFNNTVFLNGKLQLVELAKDDNNQIIYAPEGYWISETIRVADKVTSFKYIAKNIVGNGSYKIYTSSSPDGFEWTDWAEVNAADGKINSPVGYYAKIKIFINATLSNISITVDNFETSGKYINSFINSSNGVLELKKTYITPFVKSSSVSEGSLSKAQVMKTQFKKIDSINIIGG
ncbi:hypothetical protein BSK59_12855 [Paenibacillus odorifer]|uniref:hypothetical protein n=1 Tax=Paenibacillus odorifer TaxID=189426 RepID=UPI00096CACA9|nr:hypothetical protein [Paenibacillus odorifer]OME55363.1 hypothetical protein BSK59_12855 [Paenibacillus odorifer]